MDEAQPLTPIRVVIVDDSADIRDVLRLALDRQPDFTVVAEAVDGQSGVAVVNEHKPHLVLLDLAMPVMDGLQALERIKQESPGTIVVMLTGYAETTGALSAVELGAHGYIRKGGGIPELLTQIREVLVHRFQALERAGAREIARGDVPTRGAPPGW
jgi:DNA-binding NarL/FixJ family response regulator